MKTNLVGNFAREEICQIWFVLVPRTCLCISSQEAFGIIMSQKEKKKREIEREKRRKRREKVPRTCLCISSQEAFGIYVTSPLPTNSYILMHYFYGALESLSAKFFLMILFLVSYYFVPFQFWIFQYCNLFNFQISGSIGVLNFFSNFNLIFQFDNFLFSGSIGVQNF